MGWFYEHGRMLIPTVLWDSMLSCEISLYTNIYLVKYKLYTFPLKMTYAINKKDDNLW